MISTTEYNERRFIYDKSFEYLRDQHKSWPSVLDVTLYMTLVLKEDPEKILKIVKEIKENEK